VLPNTISEFFKGVLRKMITYKEDDRTDFLSIEGELISARLQIGRSIDPNYKYKKDASTAKEVGEVNPYKPTTSISPKKLSTESSALHGGTQTMMSVKQREEIFTARKTELFNFAYYVYKRGRLMVDLMQLINQNSYPLANFNKYTLAFLELGIFMNANREMNQYLSSKMITLPSGTQFDVLSFPPELQANLQTEIGVFASQVASEETEFNNLLKQLHTKLTSADYKARFARAYETYPDIYTALDYLVLHGQLQNSEFFTYYFEHFLKHECLMRDYRQQSEQNVRIFNMALTLCQLKTYLPDSDYMQGDAVEFVRQNFNTSPLENIYQKIYAITGI